MTIELKTIQDVKEFIEITTKYPNDDIIVEQDRYRVDGKSILGIFSLNLLKPLKVIINSDYGNSKMAFYIDIERWRIKEEAN